MGGGGATDQNSDSKPVRVIHPVVIAGHSPSLPNFQDAMLDRLSHCSVRDKQRWRPMHSEERMIVFFLTQAVHQ